METAQLSKPETAQPVGSKSQVEVQIGERIRLVSGDLAGLDGIVVRRELPNEYVIGVPDADSGVFVRVHRQRFRRLKSRHRG